MRVTILARQNRATVGFREVTTYVAMQEEYGNRRCLGH
jgi:hypothetical protein